MDLHLYLHLHLHLHPRDLNTLQGLNWLNDEVINFYLQMIVKR